MTHQQVCILVALILAVILVDLGLMYWLKQFWRQRGIDTGTRKEEVYLWGVFSPVLTLLKNRQLPEGKPPRKNRSEFNETLPDSSPGEFLQLVFKDKAGGPTDEIPHPPDVTEQKPGTAFLLLGGACLALLNLKLILDLPGQLPAPKWAILSFGLAFFLIGAQGAITGVIPRLVYRSLITLGSWLGVGLNQVFYLWLSPMFAITAALAAGDSEMLANSNIAITSWLIAICLSFAGGWHRGARFWRPSTPVLLTTTCLMTVAFLVRSFDTAHIPVVLTGDEASFGISALRFIDGHANNIFGVGYYSFPSLYFFIQSLSITMFGQTTEALRITSALAGSLTVGALYLSVRSMFGNRIAVLSSVLLAALHYHNHFSRIGLNNIWDGLGYVIALGALWHGWETGRRSSYLLAGLALGLSQYFYLTSRVLWIIIPLWLLLVGRVNPPRLKCALPGLSLMILVAGIVVLPHALYLARHFNEFIGRTQTVMIFGPWLEQTILKTGQPGWLIFFRQIYLGFQAYTFPQHNVWYDAGVPILRPIPAALFLLGIGLLAFQLRESRTILIGLWLIAFILVAVISDHTPATQRLVGAIPAVVIVVSYGLTVSSMFLSRIWHRITRLISLASLVLAIVMCVDDLRFYFLDFTLRNDFGGYGGWVAQSLADDLSDKPEESQVYFFGAPRLGYNTIPSTLYLVPWVDGIDMNYPWGSAKNPHPSGARLIFVFLPDHKTDLEGIRDSYPGGKLFTRSWDSEFLYWLYDYEVDGTDPSH